MVGKSCLCLLVFLTAGSCAAANSAAAGQANALDKLYLDWTKLKRVAGDSDIVSAESTILNSARTYEQQGLKEKDKISKLPGQPPVNFDQYGGYVTVDGETGRALFYYFAEADRSKSSKKPLLLWLNGGPGCSSFGYGAMEELGPFRVMSDGKTLDKNPFAWNNVANVLFLESPAGVGFSYSNTTSDYAKSGDQRTADDSYVFLINWLQRFPEYKGRDFYISGESYAGHYVPQLAHTILRHNKLSGSKINLRGIMIGNSVINDETDLKGMYDYFWTHALISDETIKGIHKHCNFSPSATTQGEQCSHLTNVARNNVQNFNIYNIYAPLCSSDLTPTPRRYSIRNFDPCTDDYVNTYLNNAQVQESLHANVTKLNYTWSGCSQVIHDWSDSPSTVLPLLKEFIDTGIRVWVYSGDIDGRVPVTSTRYSLNELKLQVEYEWYAWYIKNEVAGYTVAYKGNLTFATVRGAGHEVPSYQPRRALALVESFLKGKQHP